MNLSPMNRGQRIALAVRDFEQRCTQRAREWVVVFMNEETVVIAVHGALTATESALAGTTAGHAQVSVSQRPFTTTDLLEKIELICGMTVRATTVELEPTTGGVVLLFATDTAGKEFPLSPGRPVRIPGGSSCHAGCHPRLPESQQRRREPLATAPMSETDAVTHKEIVECRNSR